MLSAVHEGSNKLKCCRRSAAENQLTKQQLQEFSVLGNAQLRVNLLGRDNPLFNEL